MSADQCHRALVEDFVEGVHTPLPAFLAGIRQISTLRNVSEERAYQEIRQEALTLGGTLSMFDR